MLKRLFVFYSLFLVTLVQAQCPQVYNYLGVLSFTPNFISCTGGAYALNFQSNSSWGAYTINWGDGSPNTVGASYTANGTIIHNYAATTNTFPITLNIPSQNCTLTGFVAMEQAVFAGVIVTGGVALACAPKTLTFANVSTFTSATTTYTWNFGDGSPPVVYTSTNSGQNVTHTYNKGTVNCQTQVTLQALNYCTFGSPTTGQVNPLYVYDIDNAAITPDFAVRCWPDNTFQFTNTTARNCVPQGNTFQRQEKWNFHDYWGLGHDSIRDWSPWPPTTPVSMSYSAVGSYSVTLLDSNRCGVDVSTIVVTIANKPTALVLAPGGNLCQNTAVTFTNGSSAGVNYTWNFGAGGGFVNLGSGNKTFTYTTPGTYTVKLVASLNNSGTSCKDTSSVVINILASPVANFSVNPAVGCNTITNAVFTDMSLGAVAWNWNFGNTNTSNVQVPPPQNYVSTGTFVASLVVTASTTCNNTKTLTVMVRPKPLPLFTPFAACVGSPVTFTNTSTPLSGPNAITNYTWTFGDGSSASTATVPIHTYTAPATYTVKLIAISAFCIDSISQAVNINVKPTANFASTPTVGCPPLAVTFSNSSTSATTYLWKFGTVPASISSFSAPSFTFSNSSQTFQNYTITLIASTGAGCADSIKKVVTVYPRPVAGFFSNIITGCSPLLTTFTNTSVGYNASAWAFGDGGLSNLLNPVHTYSNTSLFTTTLTVQLVATNSLACSDTSRKLITVYPEAIFFPAMTPSAGCSPLNVNFVSVPGVAFYKFNHGDGSPTYTTLTSHNWTYTNTTNANINALVTLTAQTSNGCVGTSTGNVMVYFNPTANFTTAPNPGCTPLNVVFNNTSIGNASNKWTFGNGQSSAAANVSSTYTNATGASQITYISKLKVGTVNLCFDSITKPITVFAQPKAIFNADTPACHPKIITFSTTSIGASTYKWEFGDGLNTVSSLTTAPHLFTNTGLSSKLYLIKLRATSNNNCSDSITSAIYVHPKPQFFITSAPDSGCSPLKVYFDSIAGAKTYHWRYDNISFSSAGGISNSFDNKTNFDRTINIELVAEDVFHCADTAYKTIKVYPLPTAKFSARPLLVYIPSQETDFTNESSASATSYTWNFGDGSGSNEYSPVHFYTQAGEYQSVLMVSSDKQCRDTFELQSKVVALDETSVEIPNAFTPNAAGSHGSTYDPKDVSNDIFHPIVKGTEKYTFSIYSRWGELLFETRNPDEGWDGYYKGKLCTQDVYVWKITATFFNGKAYTKTGDVLLLR